MYIMDLIYNSWNVRLTEKTSLNILTKTQILKIQIHMYKFLYIFKIMVQVSCNL